MFASAILLSDPFFAQFFPLNPKCDKSNIYAIYLLFNVFPHTKEVPATYRSASQKKKQHATNDNVNTRFATKLSIRLRNKTGINMSRFAFATKPRPGSAAQTQMVRIGLLAVQIRYRGPAPRAWGFQPEMVRVRAFGRKLFQSGCNAFGIVSIRRGV